jgi:membrane protease YdiL (CAAX protease family)
MRIKPTALIGIGIWLVYGVVVLLIQKQSGIPYDEFGDSVANMWRATVLSLAVGTVVIVLLGLWLGWWGVAMRDKHVIRLKWTLIAPVIYLLVAIATLGTSDWGNVSAGFLLVAIVLGIGVGFAEEFVCRGLLLVGLRGSLHEVAVWLLTCVLFGVMHGANIFLGAPVQGTVQQVVLAAIQGSAFYILRRYFGTLVIAMFLHGFWDMAVFVNASSGAPATIVSLIPYLAAPFAIIGGFVVARRTQQGAVEDYAKGAAVPATA